MQADPACASPLLQGPSWSAATPATPADHRFACADLPSNPHQSESISHVRRPVPLSGFYGLFFFRQTIVACNSGQLSAFGFQIRLHPRLLPVHAHQAAFRIPLLRSALCDVLLLIRRSHFSRQRRPRFRLTGSPSLRGNASLSPTIPHVVSQFAFLLRPAALPALASALPSAVVFFC
jgi:hypothetical protein